MKREVPDQAERGLYRPWVNMRTGCEFEKHDARETDPFVSAQQFGFERQDAIVKKAYAQSNKVDQTQPVNAGAGCASQACLTRSGWCSSVGRQPAAHW